ncbi:M14 family metallopeptidase [Longimicrobium sp.]|uniref:M14 family metallopeptidase n=1 Tax=Longimicrobium sp. TaxID=2029185 RepID=UPI002E378944|nr:M14 family metallopeptidase [Longimicrobium sp.]HEX6040077.1 M14 family metallopeptidase [Longimicrobium sp.]
MAFTVRARVRAAALAALLAAPALQAQAVPSPAEVLGYELGERFTPYAGVQRYSRALADASPMVDYRAYGTTAEGRELFQLVIATPQNLQRLNDILAANAELARGASAERARQIAASNPAVVYFSYGVHGNESSSSEAALYTAWDLARGAPEVAGVLDNLVVIMDPVTNPDGRDRYVNWFTSVVGGQPNVNPQAREHREPWPGGRFNHYLFDLNRDWSWATQPETQARLATWWQWNPQVHVDFHEMFYNSSYFFFPASAPINPIYPEHILAWGRRFGQGNARAFDQQGWAYYTGEAFDLFYPGYGDSWPSLTGAVGMTYEQAGHGAAGLAIQQQSGDTLTLHDRAQHHRTTGQATLRTAAAGKAELLMDYAEAARTAGQGEADFLLVPGSDPTRVEALVAHLRRQGIEVERASGGFSARATAYPGYESRGQFPAGTYRVRARQPLGRLAVTLLQQETELKAEYSYDVSAWSLPYAYGVAAYRVAAGVGGGWSPVQTVGRPAGLAAPAPGVGYLVAPGDAASAPMIRFLQAGGRARILGRPSTFGGVRWPAGTWYIPAAGNDTVQGRVTASGLGGLVRPVASGMAESGIDLGSENVAQARLPRVALVSGEGVSATSFGAHWFYLERQLGMPFDAVMTTDLAGMDLDEYDVIVLPDASPRALRGAEDALKRWIQGGGRLVAVAGGAEAAAGMAEVKVREGAQGDSAANARSRWLAGREERQRQEWRQEVPGAIFPLRLDPAHPLAFGAGLEGRPGETFVLHGGSTVFEPGEGVETVAYFPERLERLAGVISPQQVRRLEQGSWLVTKRMGQGSVVLFADDPLFRLFWKATEPLYVNAILLGP